MIRELIFKNRNSQNVALIENGCNITFEQLFKESQKIYDELINHEHSNCVIGIFLPNCSTFVSSLFSTFILNVKTLLFNPTLTVNEICALVKQANVVTIITTTNYEDVFNLVLHQLKENHFILNIIYTDKINENKNSKRPALTIFKTINDTLLLIPTSGTTSRAKIVELSENNVLVSVKGFLNKLLINNKNKKNVTFLIITPYFTSYAIMVIMACLILQVPFVVHNDNFKIDEICKIIQQNKITHYEGSPVFLFWLEKTNPENISYDLSSLKYIAFGGSKVFEETISTAMKKFPNIKIYQGYGLSEASPLVAKPSLMPRDSKLYLSSKLSSVGTAITGVKIFVDNLGHLTQTPHTVGEIVVSGKNIMNGYFENEEQTKLAIVNGKLYTGDIGFLDKDKFLYIIGRKKNIIIVNGINVYPEEVEDVLLKSDLVNDCIVYGKTKNNNEIVCVDIVKSNETVTKENIIEYIKLNLANIKHPKIINFVDEINKNKSGKKIR